MHVLSDVTGRRTYIEICESSSACEPEEYRDVVWGNHRRRKYEGGDAKGRGRGCRRRLIIRTVPTTRYQ